MCPPVGRGIKKAMKRQYGWYDETYTDVFQRLWKGICGMGMTWLWQLRNQTIFQGILKEAQEHLEFIWNQVRAQVEAVAEYESKVHALREEGIRLKISSQCIFTQLPAPDPDNSSNTQDNRYPPRMVTSPDKPEPRLHSRLDMFIVANS